VPDADKNFQSLTWNARIALFAERAIRGPAELRATDAGRALQLEAAVDRGEENAGPSANYACFLQKAGTKLGAMLRRRRPEK
jgi:hypothetical protein